MTEVVTESGSAIQRLAYDKMSAVLGPERARRLMQQLLHRLELELQTAQDLMTFASEMSALGGFEGAVGAMLGVTAILRGAAPAVRKAAGG